MTRVVAGNPTRGSVLTIDVLTGTERDLVLDDQAPVAEIGAVWSPDARRVAVTRSLGTRTGDRFVYEASDIWIAGADGHAPRRLTRTEDGFSPVWTRDGHAIAFTHMMVPTRSTSTGIPSSTSAIWLLPVDGGGETRITEPPTGSIDRAGSFSPDGSSLAFTRCDTTRPYAPVRTPNPCAVLVTRTDGSDLHPLASRAQDPEWSPDGDTIVYASDRAQTGVMSTGEDETGYTMDLYRIRADGSAATNITNTPKLSETEPRISPGGLLLAYTQRNSDDFDRQVAIANVDATCPQQLKPDTPTDTSDWYSAPAWRPGSSASEQPRSCGPL